MLDLLRNEPCAFDVVGRSYIVGFNQEIKKRPTSL